MIKKVFLTCLLKIDKKTFPLFSTIFEAIILYFRQFLYRIPTSFPHIIKFRNPYFTKVFHKKNRLQTFFLLFLTPSSYIYISFLYLFLIKKVFCTPPITN
jgi:hypothetical protein